MNSKPTATASSSKIRSVGTAWGDRLGGPASGSADHGPYPINHTQGEIGGAVREHRGLPQGIVLCEKRGIGHN